MLLAAFETPLQDGPPGCASQPASGRNGGEKRGGRKRSFDRLDLAHLLLQGSHQAQTLNSAERALLVKPHHRFDGHQRTDISLEPAKILHRPIVGRQ